MGGKLLSMSKIEKVRPPKLEKIGGSSGNRMRNKCQVVHLGNPLGNISDRS